MNGSTPNFYKKKERIYASAQEQSSLVGFPDGGWISHSDVELWAGNGRHDLRKCHDENTYFVIRRFDSLAQREQIEDAFYGSNDWTQGPREAMVALIENYTDVVLELDQAALDALRNGKMTT